jgi:hypothetical protein
MTVLFTALLFAGYEFILNQGGVWLSSLLDVSAGTHRFGEQLALLAHFGAERQQD